MRVEPTIRHLVLKRFRSLPAERISFDNPTILVGRNGSGKSNVVSAFAFLAQAMTVPLQAVFEHAGGLAAVWNRTSGRSQQPNLGMRVDLAGLNGSADPACYAFEVKALPNHAIAVVREQCVVGMGAERAWFDRKGSRFRSNLVSLNPVLDPAALGLPVIGGEARLAPVLRALKDMRVYSIQPGRLRELQEPDSGVSLKPDGANAASVLREIQRQSPADFERITATLATIVPNTSRVQVQKHGSNLALQFTQVWGNGKPKRLDFEGTSMSDGTLRAIGLLAAVFQTPAPSLIAVEEPESTIHPGALESVLDLLLAASKRMQVVITTHSPELLDAKWITARHLRLVDWREGATRVAPLSEANRTALLGHLMGAGELMRTNALDPAQPFDEDIGRLFEDLE